MISKEEILKFLGNPKYRPLKRKELAQKLKVPSHQKKAYHQLLKNLVQEGKIIRIKSNRYALPSAIDFITGTLSANEKGFGFVIPEDKEGEDIFIAPHNMGTALDGDKVLVQLIESRRSMFRRGKRPPAKPSREGKIIDIIERSPKPIIGTLEKTERFYYVFPDNPKIAHDIYVQKNDLKKARLGDKVIVKITHWESVHTSPEGKITQVLGKTGDPWVDFKTILIHYNLNDSFPKTVIDEISKIPDSISPAEIKSRTDFRDQIVLTIDPDDAKDFDDAISLKKLKNGHYLLGVHIADVSHYVRPGTLLDKEAYQRGTSIYLPGKVIPMLPEKLSNNLCSLRPNETRLVKSVVAELGSDGAVLKAGFHNGVIHSRKRYTYKDVFEIVENKNNKLRTQNKDTVPTLDLMKELAEKLMKKRFNRGSLQLDIPAVKIRLDQNGIPIGIEKETQDIAHSMIEELMLTANECVAKHLHEKGFPCIYRVHTPPSEESLNDFIHLVKAMGFKMPPVTHSKKIQQFLDSIKEHPESGNIHYQLLRSLNRAEYSEKNSGHYALALKNYCHFTSPIRRYPDLMVHRYLDRLIQKKKKPDITPSQLGAKAKHCSVMERVAQDAEYEAIDLKKLEFLKAQMEKKKITQMKAMIRTIMPRGFFVETLEWLIDGFVPASTLTDDFYKPDAKKVKFRGERTGKSYQLGQEITVIPIKIDLAKRQIDFKII